MDERKDSPVISVVIVNYNGIGHLRKCVQSIVESNYPYYEIILVDNNSSDGSVELIRSEFRKYLDQIMIIPLHYNSGFAVGNNIGSARARGKYILLLNNDTVVAPSCLRELVAVVERDDAIGAAQAKLLLMDRRDTFDAAGGFLNVVGFAAECGCKEKDVGQYDYIFDISYSKGAAMLVRKNVWANLGGFESLFSCYFEDTDFCWRVWLSGYRVVLVPFAKVFHVGGASTSNFGRKIEFRNSFNFQEYRNRLVMVAKNLELKNFVKYVPWLFAMHLYYLLFSAFKRDISSVLGNLLGLFWSLRFFKVIWTRRLLVQEWRVVSDDYLFRKGVLSHAIIFSKCFTSTS
jgi:GT2 family glycosyltransferase